MKEAGGVGDGGQRGPINEVGGPLDLIDQRGRAVDGELELVHTQLQRGAQGGTGQALLRDVVHIHGLVLKLLDDVRGRRAGGEVQQIVPEVHVIDGARRRR